MLCIWCWLAVSGLSIHGPCTNQSARPARRFDCQSWSSECSAAIELQAGRQSIPLLLISVIWRSVCIARIQPRILFIFVVAIIASRIAIVVTANEYPDGFAINCCARSNSVGGFQNQKWRTPFQSQIHGNRSGCWKVQQSFYFIYSKSNYIFFDCRCTEDDRRSIVTVICLHFVIAVVLWP